MKIIYRCTFTWTDSRGNQLSNLGVKIKAPKPSVLGIGFGVAHVQEGAPGWIAALDLIKGWDGGIRVETEFSKQDIASADYCVMKVTHVNGYPQPEDDFLYREQTYCAQKYCSECGMGLVQKSPFRVRRNLKWGRNSFLRLFWVNDEIFVSKSVWVHFIAPLGIEAWPVLDHKGEELDDMIQLRFDRRAPLKMGDMEGVRCEVCGRERYWWIERGFFLPPTMHIEAPIFRSEQYFGSGHQSWNEIIVNADVVKTIQSAGLRGAEFWPCMPVE